MAEINYQDFEKVEIRVGTILKASEFPEARKPAYQLEIDFGPYGIKQSSAQITANYTLEELVGKQVMAVVNFPPKQIAKFMSECLVLGVKDERGEIVLVSPDSSIDNGEVLH